MEYYTLEELKDEIVNMYPEIKEHKILTSLDFSSQKNVYIVTFKRGGETLTTHLERKDADECMNGTKCVYLSVQVSQFINNFEERETFGKKVA